MRVDPTGIRAKCASDRFDPQIASSGGEFTPVEGRDAIGMLPDSRIGFSELQRSHKIGLGPERSLRVRPAIIAAASNKYE